MPGNQTHTTGEPPTRCWWRGTDDPARVDSAVLAFTTTGLLGYGTSITADYSLSWGLDVDSHWRTKRLDVCVHAAGWARSLHLMRGNLGHWSATTAVNGEVDLPDPGIADPDALVGVLDCDLGLCPATNTMPIRRLGLLDGVVAPITIRAAWVDVPSLRVSASDQIYSAADGLVDFALADESFRAQLTVDADGVVIDYPGLAQRVDVHP
ncbi:putative glycolipid-binding domain-containing protein [Williamsia sp. CHRR-6]|uniref:putative glycolipid-binding domain-containing protein n=1 Tax=Williamsia sp. CHRR-6 TaxID=2835871 RepID=UPI001BDA0810|nr:putative glycolipid-binding domain-containing protein [Williamsia sp. CHRR-6]MBT0568497.1 putative glycolipid-binding domain-containing protein [Williamsia sp. CHRR-6]